MKALGKGSIASIVKVALTIAWIVLWACLGVLTLLAIGYGILMVLVANGVVDAPDFLNEGGLIQLGGDHGPRASITFDEPAEMTWPIAVPTFLIGFVVVIGGLVIVDRLRKLFDSFTSGEPFRRENASHLRVIWIAMLAIEVLRYLLFGLTGVLIAAFGTPEGTNARFEGNIDLTNWMAIAVLIVLAEVFREGARLKEEQELTI